VAGPTRRHERRRAAADHRLAVSSTLEIPGGIPAGLHPCQSAPATTRTTHVPACGTAADAATARHRTRWSVRGTDMHSARGGTDAPTRPTPPGGPAPGGPLVPPPAPMRGDPHDVRRKRPPALAFILRMDTLRRLARGAARPGAGLRDTSRAVF